MASGLPGGCGALVSPRSVRWRELGLDLGMLAEPELLDLLSREPRILRRPLVTDGRRTVVGWDPGSLAELLGR